MSVCNALQIYDPDQKKIIESAQGIRNVKTVQCHDVLVCLSLSDP